MATRGYAPNDLRRHVGSPRPKGRENKDTMCRNVLIYGHCRYEDQGCAFNHDQSKNSSSTPDHRSSSKKTLNVDSPSFTPSSGQSKKSTLSSQAASAAVFTPRGVGATTPVPQSQQDAEPSFNPATVKEFKPQTYDLSSAVGSANGHVQDGGLSYEPFSMASVGQALPPSQYNPYAEDPASLGAPTAAFYPTQAAFATPLQPLQHHLYAQVGPHKEDLLPYQRQTYDFFISEKLREELTKKAEATLQVIPNSQLPQLDNFHSLVALDTTNRKNTSIFGYPTWVYKATSLKTGRVYCLRRLEGYRLTNEQSIRSVKEWRKVSNGNVVSIHDAFTTRAFGDSSLVFVQDYLPMSKTLAEVHLSHASNSHGGRYKTPVVESVLWGYMTQIASALKSIHGANLAARCIDLSKVVQTDKYRIRLSACSILDVVHFETRKPVAELQQEDFVHFGRAILSLATNTPSSHITNMNAALEQLSRTSYSGEFRDTVAWLLMPQQQLGPKTIDDFLRGISGHLAAAFDMSLHANDTLNTELYRELENSRVVRLLLKMGTINERMEFDGDRAWSENGERYMLKLFRDHVFHQVDANGNPVIDVGHMMQALNKLDAGTDEKITLTSRDEQTSFVVSYRELKRQLGSAFSDLFKGGKQGRAF